MLINSDKLSDSKTEQLQSILQDHHDLAVCYAMKEEMCRLYELTDYQQAVIGWTKWFQAAKESEIPALVRFAVQKEKRLPGLADYDSLSFYFFCPFTIPQKIVMNRLFCIVI